LSGEAGEIGEPGEADEIDTTEHIEEPGEIGVIEWPRRITQKSKRYGHNRSQGTKRNEDSLKAFF
jgi:hypothetical protein